MTDEELKQLVASLAIMQKEISQELRQTQLETSRQMRDTDLRMKETDLRMKETDLRMKETDLRMKETDKQIKATDRKLKELAIQIGGIGNKFGSFTEGLALPAMEKILREQFGLETITNNAKSFKGDRELELDVLGYSNGTSNKVVIVEVKSHLNERGIEQVLKIMQEFPFFFPELANKKRYGMIATVAASKEIKQKVAEAGLYLGIIHDEQFKLAHPKGFKEKCFSEAA